ncbi:MAG: BamA/TamA family outer membrane protein [Bacteroidales bacterium]|nr:BamA/TamA family outer membrane protein [Bacteroidales bacterium]
MKRILLVLAALAVVTVPLPGLHAQEKGDDKEIEKTGFSFGGLPFAAYDQDKGLQLGALVNVYDFGKGGWYPNPRQHIYADASWYTKGSQLYTLSYDNRFLLPWGIRFTFAAQFSNDKALDFYGFNGYGSYYDSSLPTAYYRISRKMPYGKLDFTGKITEHLYWKFGYHFKYFIIDGVTSDNLSSMPYKFSLFDWYKWLGFIEADEFKGGMSSAWRAGLMYDSRDVENAPSRGLWVDIGGEYAPGWMGTNKPYGRIDFTWRHYLPLAGDKLVFAYRAHANMFIGKPGFYMLPFSTYLGPGYDRDGFGGYRTIRGIMLDRIQGQSVCYFNTELRWKFLNLKVLNQNLAIGANAFFDGGRVLKDYVDVSVSSKAWEGVEIPSQLMKGASEAMHLSAGGGLRLILNRNFIIAIDYGRAFNKQDNAKGSFYVNTGYIF